MRYVLGAHIGPVSIVTVPTPTPAKSDVVGTLVSFSPTEVVLSFPAFDAAQAQAPVETRVYLAPPGETLPADAQAWVDSALNFSSTSTPVGPEGAGSYSVPVPTAPVGDYIGQVVHGFAD